jgi:hypothetical protein
MIEAVIAFVLDAVDHIEISHKQPRVGLFLPEGMHAVRTRRLVCLHPWLDHTLL